MNPLNHFGIRSQFIRGDTSSYNNASGTAVDGGNQLSEPSKSRRKARVPWLENKGKPITIWHGSKDNKVF